MAGVTRRAVAGLGLALMLVVAACSTSGTDNGSSTSNEDPDDVIAGSVLVLPGEPTAPVQSVALTRHYDRGLSTTVYELVRLDGVGDTPVWRTPPLGDDAYHLPLVSDGTRLLTAIGTKVYAFDLATGQPVWEATLSDVYQPNCENCFDLVGGQLVVRSFDSVIHTIDTSTGSELWSHRLENVSGAARVVGSRVIMIDGSYDDTSTDVIDPATGSTLLTLSTGCHEEGSIIPPRPLEADATILTTSAEPDMVYLGYGYIPACWQKWNLADGSLVWDTVLPDDYLDDDVGAVLNESRLTFSTRNPSLVQIDAATGAGAVVPVPPDASVTPLTTVGSTIVAQAVTNRGTPEWSIMGIDAATGQVGWNTGLGAASPADTGLVPSPVPSTEQEFITHIAGDQADVVTLDGGTGRFSTQRISLADGRSTPPVQVAFGTDATTYYFDEVSWNGPIAVLVVGESLVVLDTTTSTVTWSY